MKRKILLLTLKTFSATGGIEKVCRVVGKSLYEFTLTGNAAVGIYSMYDKQSDAAENIYFPSELLRGFSESKVWFIIRSVLKGIKQDTIIMSHINLLLVGWLIKKLSPRTKIVLFAHGIEVWNELSFFKKRAISCCDVIIPVSNFTSEKIQRLHHVAGDKCKVLNNCLDPFLPLGKEFIEDTDLRVKYGFNKDDKVLLTLSRLSSKERYKGYDRVLEAMVELKEKYPSLKYLLAGSYDEKEKAYLDNLIEKLDLRNVVKIPGFIPEEDLVAHFRMADIYVMPSMKEGFGIVFIEAMNYDLPVIAGNIDGSVDALCNGELGILVDPLSAVAVEKAIDSILQNKDAYKADRKLLLQHFSYTQYKKKIEKILFS